MRRIHRILGFLLLWGCGDDAAPPADAPPPDAPVFMGGSIAVSCGYTVTTPVDATAPVLGTDVLGAEPAPRQLHLGLASDPATSMVVSWRTDAETLVTTVEYGVTEALEMSATGITFLYQPTGGRAVRVHETHLCGLMPDTTYSYRVGGIGSGTTAWSEWFTFRTAPATASADAEVVIGVLGDTRSGYDVWKQCLELLDTTASPDLILFNGDATLLGTDQGEWDTFLDNGESVLRRIPILSAHGNHELNSANYYSLFAMPGDEQYFSVDYGPAHITVLNDEPLNVEDRGGRAVEFMNADFTAAAARPWKLVMHHSPIYSAGSFHGSDEELRALWEPVFDTHHVDLVVNGHEHDYERTKPMRAGAPQATPAEGTIYAIVGSAGAELREVGSGAWTEIAESTYSVMVLRVRAGMLSATAYRQDGTMLDEFTIIK
jgi:acid phosphatase type 7